MHLKLSLLLILIVSLSFPFAYSDLYSNPCTTDPFDCSNLGYITYPFWGGNRPQHCGRSSSFELFCVQEIAMLNISSVRYQVKEIDFDTSNLKVARDDLLLLLLDKKTSICPPHYPRVPDTYFDPDLFHPPNKNYTNITLYFGCKLPHDMIDPVNTFRCTVDGVEAINLFGTKPESVSCKDNIFVPTNKVAAAQYLGDPNDSSIDDLRYALSMGFWIQWLNDGLETFTGLCNPHVPKVAQTCEIKKTCGALGICSDSFPPPPVQSPPVQSTERSPAADENPPPQSTFPKGPGPVQSPAGSLVITSNGAPTPFQIQERLHNKTRRKTLVVVLVVTGIVVLITISLVCFIKRRCFPTSADQESNYQAVEAFLLQHGPLALKRYKYSEIKKMTKSLSDKLGQGGYGSVYKGKLPDGTLIAVKVLSSTDGNVEDFVNEVASIGRTSHVNIVNLLGFCFDRKNRALVYEYMPNKSLDKYINNSGSTGTNCCLDIEILYRIAAGVAEGLDYLHRCCNTRIVHFDIKPQNILLDEEFCPKISDFGLAKLCKKKQSLLSVLGTRGTVGYIAPEVFSRNFGGVSHKSDVYSYGMMVLEMAGANMLADPTNETTQSIENYFPDKIYERVLDTTRKLDGFEIEVKEETARKMLLIGFWCIQTNPSDRPSISKVVEMFGGSIESIQTPPKPVLFTPTLPVWGVSSSFSSYVEETQPSAEGVTQTQFKVSVNGFR